MVRNNIRASKEVIISKQIDIAAAHRLDDGPEHCQRIHGHNFVVVAHCLVVSGEGLQVTFGEMKSDLMRVVHEPFDHRFINEVPPFDQVSPSTENFAYHILTELLKIRGNYVAVDVYENYPNNRGRAEREDHY